MHLKVMALLIFLMAMFVIIYVRQTDNICPAHPFVIQPNNTCKRIDR